MTISPVIREVQLNTCNKYYREHMLKESEEKLERNGYNRLLVLLRPAEPVWNQFTGVSSRLYIRYLYMC